MFGMAAQNLTANESDLVATAHHAELRAKLRGFSARVLGVAADHPDAEDCAQEALSRWLAAVAEQPGAGYVFGIARNVALDHLRRRARRRESLAGAPDSESDLGRLASSAPSPEEQSERNQRDGRLLRALDDLPENQRVALRMFYLERLPYDAIGKRLGVPAGTVATWLSRGKSQLAAQLRRIQ